VISALGNLNPPKQQSMQLRGQNEKTNKIDCLAAESYQLVKFYDSRQALEQKRAAETDEAEGKLRVV